MPHVVHVEISQLTCKELQLKRAPHDKLARAFMFSFKRDR